MNIKTYSVQKLSCVLHCTLRSNNWTVSSAFYRHLRWSHTEARLQTILWLFRWLYLSLFCCVCRCHFIPVFVIKAVGPFYWVLTLRNDILKHSSFGLYLLSNAWQKHNVAEAGSVIGPTDWEELYLTESTD